MGKYRAMMNLGGHRRGEVKDYDESDAVLLRRVKAGWLVPVGVPAGAKPVVKDAPFADDPNPRVEVEGSVVVDNLVDDVPTVDDVKPAPAKKRAPAKKKAVVQEPVVEDAPVEEQSSVQTSWFISPTQSEG